MPKSKNRKNHKKKVALRNRKMKEQKAKIEKLQREFIMDLINKEKESGKFTDTKTVDVVDSFELDSTGISQSSIDESIIDEIKNVDIGPQI